MTIRRILVSLVLAGVLGTSTSVAADTRVEDADELFSEGMGYVSRGYYTLGVSALERAVAANNKHFDALLVLADYVIIDERSVRYASPKRNERARKLYERALELRPDSPTAHNNLAWLLLQTGGDVDDALEHAERAVALDPGRSEYMDTLALAYCQAERFAEARAILARALAAAPDAPYLQHRSRRICSKEPDEWVNKQFPDSAQP